MKRRLLILGLALAPLWAIAQNLISGHIKDVRTGEPLIGASVIVKSEKGQGVVTNVDVSLCHFIVTEPVVYIL